MNEKTNDQNKDTNDEEEEARKQREQSWKMMKYSFLFFGVSIGLTGSYIIYELSRSNYDEHGNLIEDEYSHLPYLQQIWKRFRREFTYYKRVIIFSLYSN